MDPILSGGENSSYDPFLEFGLPIDQGFSIGIPRDPVGNTPVYGLETTSAAVQEAPPISTFDRLWGAIKQDSSGLLHGIGDAGKNAYGGISDITKTVYGDVKSAAGTVYDDVSKPLSGIIGSAYTYIIVAVVVLGGVIYFAGKSGALRVSR